jgi:Glycosyl hydrolase family 36 C-terminal domain
LFFGLQAEKQQTKEFIFPAKPPLEAGCRSDYFMSTTSPAAEAPWTNVQIEMEPEPEYHLRPRGLDISKRYKVTWDNSGQTCEVDGFTLVQRGVVVRLEGALTSELLLFEAL